MKKLLAIVAIFSGSIFANSNISAPIIFRTANDSISAADDSIHLNIAISDIKQVLLRDSHFYIELDDSSDINKHIRFFSEKDTFYVTRIDMSDSIIFILKNDTIKTRMSIRVAGAQISKRIFPPSLDSNYIKKYLASNGKIIPDSNFEVLGNYCNKSKLIFLGESPSHNIPDLFNVGAQIAVSLRKINLVSVIGYESLYGLYPFFERQSLEASPLNSKFVSPIITSYNSSVANDKKLLVTSLDIEHSINHSKNKTIDYLMWLTNFVQNSKTKEDIKAFIPQLNNLSNSTDIYRYIDTLQGLFQIDSLKYSDSVKNEINFTFDIFRASIDYQDGYVMNPPKSHDIGAYDSINEIRGNFFRKTIERAIKKADLRHGNLICYVGGAHAVKLEEKHSGAGKWPEAYYFDKIEKSTHNSVTSILLQAISFKNDINTLTYDFEHYVLSFMGKSRFFYLSTKNIGSLIGKVPGLDNFLIVKKPKHDGVLFIADCEKPEDAQSSIFMQ